MCSGKGYQNGKGTQVKTMSHKEHLTEMKTFNIKDLGLRENKPDNWFYN